MESRSVYVSLSGIGDPVHIPDAAGADSKSFVKQIAESQGPVVKRRLEDAPADSDYLVRDCTQTQHTHTNITHSLPLQKWTVFAASMTPPPRVDGSQQPHIA